MQNTNVNRIFLIVFISTLISGALRKWYFTSGPVSNMVLLIQLLIPYIFIFKPSGFRNPFMIRGLIIFIFLLVMEAFNPLNLTIYHGLLGIILHLGFWYAIFFYIVNRDKIGLKKMIPIVLICLYGEIVLGFIQYQLPPDNILNTYANTEIVGGIALVGTSVRLTGTFSYISGYTGLLLFVILFVWALFRYKYEIWQTIILLLTGFIASLMSGSRAATASYIIISILIFLSETKSANFRKNAVKIVLPIIGLFMVTLFFNSDKIIDQADIIISNFNERVEYGVKNGEQKQRIFLDLNDLIAFKGDNPIFGVGLGATYQGATNLFGTSYYLKKYGYYENELTRIVLEGGFVLLAFRFLLMGYVVYSLRINLLSKIVLFILLFYFTYIVFNIYNSIFTFLGLAFLDNSYHNRTNHEPQW